MWKCWSCCPVERIALAVLPCSARSQHLPVIALYAFHDVSCACHSGAHAWLALTSFMHANKTQLCSMHSPSTCKQFHPQHMLFCHRQRLFQPNAFCMQTRGEGLLVLQRVGATRGPCRDEGRGWGVKVVSPCSRRDGSRRK